MLLSSSISSKPPMKKIILPALLLAAMAFLFSCHHRVCCTPGIPNAGALFLSIKKHGEPYPDSLMSGVTMYYYSNGKKISRPSDDPNRTFETPYGDTLLYRVRDSDSGALIPGEFSSSYALDAISYSHVNDFYIRYPDGAVDSLHIQMKTIKDEEVDNITYGCTRQITSITLNGKALSSTPNLHNGFVIDNAIYLIEQ